MKLKIFLLFLILSQISGLDFNGLKRGGNRRTTATEPSVMDVSSVQSISTEEVTETSSLPPTEGSTCAGNKAIQCSGCNKYLVCAGKEVISEHVCDRFTPHCNEGARNDLCSSLSNREECRTDGVKQFVCTQEGYFPEPSNCRIYHICVLNGTLFRSVDYLCPLGHYFDVSRKQCRQIFFTELCLRQEAHCNVTQHGKFEIYTHHPRYYYYCDPKEGLIMFRCPENSKFDGVECAYNCQMEGTFPDSDNPARFFTCWLDRYALRSRIERCPLSFVFNAEKKQCVSKEK